MDREERKELLIQLEETQTEKEELLKVLKPAGEILRRLGEAIVKDSNQLVFSNRKGFTISVDKLRTSSFDFERLPKYGWIADTVWKYQQLIQREKNLKRKLGR